MPCDLRCVRPFPVVGSDATARPGRLRRNRDTPATLAEDVKKLEQVHTARAAWHQHTEPTREQAQAAKRQLELRAPEPEPLELPEDVQQAEVEPELEQQQSAEPEQLQQARERAHESGRTLTGEELQRAVDIAKVATEVLADREQTRQMEEAERARRDEPHVVQALEPVAVERVGREVEM